MNTQNITINGDTFLQFTKKSVEEVCELYEKYGIHKAVERFNRQHKVK